MHSHPLEIKKKLMIRSVPIQSISNILKIIKITNQSIICFPFSIDVDDIFR